MSKRSICRRGRPTTSSRPARPCCTARRGSSRVSRWCSPASARAGLRLQHDVIDELRRAGDSDALLAHGLAYLGHCRRHLGDRSAAWADLTEAAMIWQRLGNQGSSIHVLARSGRAGDRGRRSVDRADPRPRRTVGVEPRRAARSTTHGCGRWLLARTTRWGTRCRSALAAGRAVGALGTTADGERGRVASALASIACDLDEPRIGGPVARSRRSGRGAARAAVRRSRRTDRLDILAARHAQLDRCQGRRARRLGPQRHRRRGRRRAGPPSWSRHRRTVDRGDRPRASPDRELVVNGDALRYETRPSGSIPTCRSRADRGRPRRVLRG